jgi:hypothetical protein
MNLRWKKAKEYNNFFSKESKSYFQFSNKRLSTKSFFCAIADASADLDDPKMA